MSMRRFGIKTEYSIGTAGQAGEAAVWNYNAGELWDGTSHLIVALHGHGTAGQDAAMPLQFNQNTGPGLVPMALARTGRYVVLSIEAAGATSWSKPAVMDRIDAAIVAAVSRGVKSGKYGLLGWSMGGLEVANKIKRDASRIAAAWTWAPVIDLDFVNSTSAHVPASNNAQWATELTAAFGSYAATAGYRVWDEPQNYRDLGVPWKICHATNDTVVPQSVSTSFVANVNDPNITMRTPDVLGDHTGLFAFVPTSETVAFYDAGNW